MARRAATRILVLALFCMGCATARQPVLRSLRDAPDKTPVVLLPGTTGTKLRDSRSGRILWGRVRNLFLPRDGGYELALSIDPGVRESPVEAFAPVLEIDLLVWKKPIYGPWVRLMEQNGYTLGELEAPEPDDTFFFFNYDWRQGNVDAAGRLARQLEALRVVRGEDELTVTLICQSNAALICRYLVKYAGVSLEEAESGTARPPEGIRVDKLILVGASNGGALRVLREMNRGRTYISPVGRRWLPEVLFTFPSLYESLPVYRQDLFFDEEGRSVEADLFDADHWERFDWSIHAPKVERRLIKRKRDDLFGDAAERKIFQQRALDRARRLHRVLAEDPPDFEPPRYFAVQNVYYKTANRALLVRTDRSWRTFFTGSARLERAPYLLALASAPGDGHATRESQNWLSPLELGAFGQPPAYIEGRHFEIILSPATQRRILEFLDSGAPEADEPSVSNADLSRPIG